MTGSALTKPMRTALTAARGQPLRRVHNDRPGKPPWPAHPSTLRALVDRGLLVRGELVNRNGFRVDVWTITDAGRDALDPPPAIRRRTPLYVAEGWPDYTGDSSRKMRGEPEALDEQTIGRYARESEQDRVRRLHDYEQARRDMALEDRLAAVREAARRHGLDLRRQEASVAQRIAAMERLVQRRSAA